MKKEFGTSQFHPRDANRSTFQDVDNVGKKIKLMLLLIDVGDSLNFDWIRFSKEILLDSFARCTEI